VVIRATVNNHRRPYVTSDLPYRVSVDSHRTAESRRCPTLVADGITVRDHVVTVVFDLRQLAREAVWALHARRPGDQAATTTLNKSIIGLYQALSWLISSA